MDLPQLAILTNQLGYDDAADVLKVPVDLLRQAIKGETLSNFETAQIESGFNRLILDSLYAFKNDIDISKVERYGEQLEDIERFFYDVNFANTFRQGVAEKHIDVDDLDRGGLMFADLTPSQAKTIIEYIEQGETKEIKKMFDAYIEDYERGGIWDIENSEFWEWFRETFYAE